MEENIPGSDQVLDLVIGEKIAPSPPKLPPPAPSKLRISSPVVITKPKEDTPAPAPVMSVPPPPIEPPTVSSAVKETEGKAETPAEPAVKPAEPLKVEKKPEEMVIKQGDDGDVLYVIESGTLSCFKN